MSKNICIFADGTGQGGKVGAKDNTNVWRLYCATRTFDQEKQLCHYDAGLGAKSGGWTRWGYDKLSQATGLGISKNIKECYDFLLKEHRRGDRIFLFGFSRGAYTVRSLGGVLKLCGIPTDWRDEPDEASREKARAALVEEAVETIYKHYGDGAKELKRKELGRAFFDAHRSEEGVPYFIGVWDTVRALGFPGSTGLDFFRHAFHDSTLDPRVRYARQALSIDENRKAFRPDIWEASAQDLASGRIKQHWFPGVHSDIGGGYEDATLADIALHWIVQEATEGIDDPDTRLLVNESRIPPLSAAHPLGVQHDERVGWWGRRWREGTREEFHAKSLWEGAVLADPSVFTRVKADSVPFHQMAEAKYRPVAIAGRFLPDWTLPPP